MTNANFEYRGYTVECDGPGLYWQDELGISASSAFDMIALIDKHLYDPAWDDDFEGVLVDEL